MLEKPARAVSMAEVESQGKPKPPLSGPTRSMPSLKRGREIDTRTHYALPRRRPPTTPTVSAGHDITHAKERRPCLPERHGGLQAFREETCPTIDPAAAPITPLRPPRLPPTTPSIR